MTKYGYVFRRHVYINIKTHLLHPLLPYLILEHSLHFWILASSTLIFAIQLINIHWLFDLLPYLIIDRNPCFWFLENKMERSILIKDDGPG